MCMAITDKHYCLLNQKVSPVTDTAKTLSDELLTKYCSSVSDKTCLPRTCARVCVDMVSSTYEAFSAFRAGLAGMTEFLHSAPPSYD